MKFINRNNLMLLSGAAFISFLGRTFLDFNIVYPEMGVQESELFGYIIFNLVFFAGWLWALMAAIQGSKRALIVTLLYDVLLLVFGLSTIFTLCPTPCGTAWPIGELLIWSNIVIAVPLLWIKARHLWWSPETQLAT